MHAHGGKLMNAPADHFGNARMQMHLQKHIPMKSKIYILISIILFNLSSNFEKVLEQNKDSEPEVA